MFTRIDTFTCPICNSRFIYNIKNTKTIEMTSKIFLDKRLWNQEVSEHYLKCSEKKPESFDERFCNFLRSIGINVNG